MLIQTVPCAKFVPVTWKKKGQSITTSDSGMRLALQVTSPNMKDHEQRYKAVKSINSYS